MSYNRGDIIEFYLELPYQSHLKPHPFVIISNDDVFEEDGMYVCVMITHSQHTDKYSFEIEDKMLVNKSDGRFSQVRCHLIVNVKAEDIQVTKTRNSMKKRYVNSLVSYINTVTLSE